MGDGKIAVDEFAVLVRQELHASELARLSSGLGELGPVRHGNAPHGNAAVLAMPGSVKIEIALDLLEVGQDVVPVPAFGTTIDPFLVVGRSTAVGHLAVDRRAAA